MNGRRKNKKSKPNTAMISKQLGAKTVEAKKTPKKQVCFGVEEETEFLWYGSDIPGNHCVAERKRVDKVLKEFATPVTWTNAVWINDEDLQNKKGLKQLKSAGRDDCSSITFNETKRMTLEAEQKYAAIHKTETRGHGVFSREFAPKDLRVLYAGDFLFKGKDPEYDKNRHSFDFMDEKSKERVATIDASVKRNLASFINHSYRKEIYESLYWFRDDKARDMVAPANIISVGLNLPKCGVAHIEYKLIDDIPKGEEWLCDYNLAFWHSDEYDEPLIPLKGGGGKTMDRSWYLGPLRIALPSSGDELDNGLDMTGKQRKALVVELKKQLEVKGDDAQHTFYVQKPAPGYDIILKSKELLAVLEETEKTRKTRVKYQGYCNIVKRLPSLINPDEKPDVNLRLAAGEAKVAEDDFHDALLAVVKLDVAAIEKAQKSNKELPTSRYLLNAKSVNGKTALHLAAEAGLASRVAELIRAGADPTIKTPDGKTAYDLGVKLPDGVRKELQVATVEYARKVALTA